MKILLGRREVLILSACLAIKGKFLVNYQKASLPAENTGKCHRSFVRLKRGRRIKQVSNIPKQQLQMQVIAELNMPKAVLER